MLTYLIVKSVHIISVIAWMAGLLYLPRLFVYHTSAALGSEMDHTFQTMEKRLLRFIINPAMIATFIFGFWLVALLGPDKLGGWFLVKFLLVILLSGLHGAMAKWRKDFILGQNIHSAKFYRLMNEIPALCMVIIVFMVILKPF